MKLSEDKIKSVLRQNGYKATPQRLTIIKEFAKSDQFLTPADLYEKLKTSNPDTGMVTVYRVLDMLDRLGLVCKVHAGGDCHKYKINTAEHHHHLLCSNCGIIINFPCDEPNLEELRKKITAETGFNIKTHILEFVGFCPRCSNESQGTDHNIKG
ncbi:MAG: transcriptional repressor [Dehalococcoidales bacterium]|nr:transcriptional repressor [Dehalococcoidales bacterium]